MPKKKKSVRHASKVLKANDGNDGNDGNNDNDYNNGNNGNNGNNENNGNDGDEQSRRKTDVQTAMNTIELSTVPRPLSDTGQAECLQLRQALDDTADGAIEKPPTTTDERIPPEFIHSPGFTLSAMDLAKGTVSLESIDAYGTMPINKNDPTLKCFDNRPLVKVTRIAWEEVSDLVQEQSNKFLLEWLTRDNAFPMHLDESWLKKHKMSVRTKQILKQAMLARYSALQQANEDYHISSCPLHGSVPPSDLLLKVILGIGDALTHRDVFLALFKGSLNGNSLALLSLVSYMLNCEHIFEKMLLRAHHKAKDTKDTKDTKHYDSEDANFVSDLSMGRGELFRLCTVVYWSFQQYAKVVSSVERLYLYEMHTHAQAWKAHAQILSMSAASIVDKNQELVQDNEELAKNSRATQNAAILLRQEMRRMLQEAELAELQNKVAKQLTAAQFQEHQVKIEEQQRDLLQKAKQIQDLDKQVQAITADYEDFIAKTTTAGLLTTITSKLLTTGECAICLQAFSEAEEAESEHEKAESEHEIWALVPCGHTNVCKACLDKHVMPALAKPAIVSFKCPSCQTEVTSMIRVFGVEREQQENLDA